VPVPLPPPATPPAPPEPLLPLPPLPLGVQALPAQPRVKSASEKIARFDFRMRRHIATVAPRAPPREIGDLR
jgi:hypothetical protein